MTAELPADEALLLRFRENADAAAFDALARRYWRPALAVARGQPGIDAHLAEDAVQEALVRVFRHAGRFDPQRSFAAWFYTILRNACADLRRRRTRQAALADRWANDPACPLAVAPAVPSEEAALLALAPADREILIYRLVHGMSFAEIASQLDCPLETAKKRAQRALHRLRQSAAESAADGAVA